MLAARGELTLNQRTKLTALRFSSRTVNRKPFSHCNPVNKPANSQHGRDYKHCSLNVLVDVPVLEKHAFAVGSIVSAAF